MIDLDRKIEAKATRQSFATAVMYKTIAEKSAFAHFENSSISFVFA